MLVNNKKISLEDITSDYVYVSSHNIKTNKKILPMEKRLKLRHVCEMASWENKLSGALLAGWIVSSMACSAFNWRTHIWIMGPFGTGKSTLMKGIIERAMKSIIHICGQGTTEAGIREQLMHDGRPILYDEADQDETGLKNIMQGVLRLTRGASDGVTVGKFGQERTKTTFAACFGGINPLISSSATQSRIMQLRLTPPQGKDKNVKFEEWQKEIECLLDNEFSGMLFELVANNLNTLLDNFKIFKIASMSILDNSRSADQMGYVLSGLYLLHSTDKVSLKKAKEWIMMQNWDNYVSAKDDTEAVAFVKYVGAAVIPIITETKRRNLTVGELISCVSHSKGGLTREDASAELGKYGIKYYKKRIYIANKNQNFAKLIKDKDMWHTGDSGWANILEYYPDAQKTKNAINFSNGVPRARAISIPADIFIDDMRDEIDKEFDALTGIGDEEEQIAWI